MALCLSVTITRRERIVRSVGRRQAPLGKTALRQAILNIACMVPA